MEALEHQDVQPHVAETMGSLCWLAMDAAWMLQWRTLATILVVPSVVAHLWLFRRGSTSLVTVCVTASLNCWLGMNALWMLSDLWSRPPLLMAAKVFSALAAALIVVAFFASQGRPEARSLVFRGFRRIRVAFGDKVKL